MYEVVFGCNPCFALTFHDLIERTEFSKYLVIYVYILYYHNYNNHNINPCEYLEIVKFNG